MKRQYLGWVDYATVNPFKGQRKGGGEVKTVGRQMSQTEKMGGSLNVLALFRKKGG